MFAAKMTRKPMPASIGRDAHDMKLGEIVERALAALEREMEMGERAK